MKKYIIIIILFIFKQLKKVELHYNNINRRYNELCHNMELRIKEENDNLLLSKSTKPNPKKFVDKKPLELYDRLTSPTKVFNFDSLPELDEQLEHITKLIIIWKTMIEIENDLNNAIECEVCHCKMNDVIILKCGHSCCSKCGSRMINLKLRCPIGGCKLFNNINPTVVRAIRDGNMSNIFKTHHKLKKQEHPVYILYLLLIVGKTNSKLY